MLNKNLLKGTMALHGDSQRKLAKEMGVSENTLMWKIQGKYEFKQKEIMFITKRYKLTPQHVSEIFFSKGV